MRCFGSGMFIPDSNISILDPESRVKKIPKPGTQVRIRIKKNIFSPKKLFSKLSKNLSGIFIPDPDFFHSGSRGQKVIGSRIRILNTASMFLLLRRALPVLEEDNRLVSLVQNLDKRYTGEDYSSAKNGDRLSLQLQYQQYFLPSINLLCFKWKGKAANVFFAKGWVDSFLFNRLDWPKSSTIR